MPAENAGRAFALVLTDELARGGVRHAVVAPGSRSTPIALALLEHPDITVHVRVDERSAAYLALGIAKASHQVVPVLCTSGTATAHFHGAVMEADLARVPLLVLTADRPAELHGIGANQTVEQSGLYGSAVRSSIDVPAPEARPNIVVTWRQLTREALADCAGGEGIAAGPVHLNLALREPLVPVDDGIGFPYELGLGGPPVGRARVRLVAGTDAALAQALTGVRNGVVVVGDVAGDPDPVVRWCEAAGWPLVAEPHSNARRGGCAIRASDVLLRDPGFVAANTPDLVVVAGRVGLSRVMQDWLRSLRHVVLSPDGASWDTTRSAEAVVTTSTEAFDRLDVQAYRADGDWLTAWVGAAKRAGDAIDAVLDESGELTEPRVARDVVRGLPTGAALVVASSMPIRDLDLVMEPRADITVYANRGVSGIDGFVSTAQGVSFGHSSGPTVASAPPTVALCGDLSLLHDSNGLLPGSPQPPDVTYVVVNNDGGGIFSLLPQGTAVEPTAFERLFGTPHGVRLETLAAAYSVGYRLVESPDQLANALSTFGGLRIVEVRSERAGNAALHARLREITTGTG